MSDGDGYFVCLYVRSEDDPGEWDWHGLLGREVNVYVEPDEPEREYALLALTPWAARALRAARRLVDVDHEIIGVICGPNDPVEIARVRAATRALNPVDVHLADLDRRH